MLNHLTLENFKAWRRVDLRFGKVTGFFGANSAGKSSLLQFLLMLKQTRNATDRGVVLELGGESDLVSLGTFSDVVHRHDEAESIRWSFDWTLPRVLDLARSDGPPLRGTQLGTQCEVGIERRIASIARACPPLLCPGRFHCAHGTARNTPPSGGAERLGRPDVECRLRSKRSDHRREPQRALLRRLQRRVAESGNEPEQLATAENVKLYFVSSHRGEAQCADLQLNEYGEIENWPPNLFGDEMGEVEELPPNAFDRSDRKFLAVPSLPTPRS